MRYPYLKNKRVHLPIIAVLIAFLFSGCAGQRWGKALAEEERDPIIHTLITMWEEEQLCPDHLDGDAQIFWESPMDSSAVEGYLQLLSPSFIKFIISNPLGQPVFAFSSNGEEFQILKPNQYQHTRGTVRSLAIRQEIPQILAQGDWFAYLTGRLPATPLQIEQIHQGAADDTFWLRLSSAVSDQTGETVWVHVHSRLRTVLGYLFLDNKGSTVAEIIYAQEEGSTSGRCEPVKEMTITGLPWGSEMRLKLRAIEMNSQGDEKSFSLPVPPGYTTQLQL